MCDKFEKSQRQFVRPTKYHGATNKATNDPVDLLGSPVQCYNVWVQLKMAQQ